MQKNRNVFFILINAFKFRFKQNPKAVMIASDVAARGLDIPLVEHVIHYQLPRSSDVCYLFFFNIYIVITFLLILH